MSSSSSDSNSKDLELGSTVKPSDVVVNLDRKSSGVVNMDRKPSGVVNLDRKSSGVVNLDRKSSGVVNLDRKSSSGMIQIQRKVTSSSFIRKARDIRQLG